ncbi:MAG: hypothetical protein Q7R35_08495 [Elusimicrobiota bacterium]|nr:hypothetical protein [Elusimicrobiota bacterium]
MFNLFQYIEYMRLENCKTEINQVVSAPIIRTKPEDDWVTAKDSGVLPLTAFTLYSRANFLSFDTEPPFLADKKRILFSYFSMLLTSIKESLLDADCELHLFIKARAQVYDPGKKLRGETWDATADNRARKHFRIYLLSLQAGLDANADLIAMFLPNLIPGLNLGRAHFSRVEAWLAQPLVSTGGIVSPQRYYLEQLYTQLRPLVQAKPPEKDWLQLMRMFRNKAAHLGDRVFRYVGLHDSKDMFYTFIPREWPFLWEEHINLAGGSPQSGQQPTVGLLLHNSLVHEDIVSYSLGLQRKVTELIATNIDVIDSAYAAFQDFQPNNIALAELTKSFMRSDFEHFLGGNAGAGSGLET